MSFKKLQEFIQLARESGVKDLEYVDGDKKFSISFPVGDAPVFHEQLVSVPQSGMQPLKKEEIKNAPGVTSITSPFVGTFYISSSPDTAAYVKNGDNISKGQVLCIVEAMKIMNEIESEISGEVIEICVENESYVEFGQTLFKVKKA